MRCLGGPLGGTGADISMGFFPPENRKTNKKDSKFKFELRLFFWGKGSVWGSNGRRVYHVTR